MRSGRGQGVGLVLRKNSQFDLEVGRYTVWVYSNRCDLSFENARMILTSQAPGKSEIFA